MEKTLDHVNWEFLFYMLERCWLGFRWYSWIRHCVSTPQFSILANGNFASFFHSSCQLRQGNPLSHFLFVIVMEALGRMLQAAAVWEGNLSGFSIGNDTYESITLSHLLFAYDTYHLL